MDSIGLDRFLSPTVRYTTHRSMKFYCLMLACYMHAFYQAILLTVQHRTFFYLQICSIVPAGYVFQKEVCGVGGETFTRLNGGRPFIVFFPFYCTDRSVVLYIKGTSLQAHTPPLRASERAGGAHIDSSTTNKQ